LGTGVVFMSVATLLWSAKPFTLPKSDLGLPLAIYLSNFAFATIMSLAAGFYIPVLLGTFTGAIPAIVFYRMAQSDDAIAAARDSSNRLSSSSIPVGVMPK
jgi:uncharacterized membrane protein